MHLRVGLIILILKLGNLLLILSEELLLLVMNYLVMVDRYLSGGKALNNLMRFK